LHADDPGDAELYRLLSADYQSVAAFEGRAGNVKAALDAVRRHLELTERWVSINPGQTAEAALAAANERYGVALSAAGDLEAARRAYDELIRLRERLAAGDTPASNRIALARAYNLYGDLLASPFEPNWEDPAGARQSYEKSLAIREELLAEDPTSASAGLDLAFTLFNIAALERESAPDVSVRTMRRAMDVSARTLGNATSNADARRSRALMQMMYASALSRAGKHAEALALYPAVLEVLEPMRAREPARVALTHELMITFSERGDLYVAMGRRDAALDDYQRALALGEQHQPRNLRIAVMLGSTYARLEKHYRTAGNGPAACGWATRAVQLWSGWAEQAPGAFSERSRERARITLKQCDGAATSVTAARP
jgi:tetratricopeptide (TPR) repeat protein